MIFNIEVGGTNTTDATASAADILSPKTAYTASGLTSGTMVTRTYPAVQTGIQQGSPLTTITFSTQVKRLEFNSGFYSTFGWYSIASISNQTLPTSTANTAVGTAKTLNISASADKYLNIPVGYLSSSTYYTISMMTLPTTFAVASTGTQKATIGMSSFTRYLNIPIGYNAASAYYTIESVASGTAAMPATTIIANPTFSFDASTGELTATVSASSSISPTVTEGYVSEGTAGTVSAAGTGIYSMTVMTLPASPTTTRISQYEIGRTTVSTTDMYLNIPQGYNSRSGFYTVQSVATMTLPTSAITTSTGTLKSTIDRSTATRYLNIPTGYLSQSAYYKISSVPNATMPTTTYSTAIQGTNIATFGAYSYSQYLFIPSGYVQGGSYYTISGDRNLIAGNIKSGTSIFGVEGTYYGVDTTDATATADQIYSGATAYISTGKVSGTMPNITLPTTFATTPTGTNIGGINRSNTTRYLNVPQGYHTRSEYYTIASVQDMTLSQDTSTTSVGTFVSQLANWLNTSTYLNIPAGYLSSSSYYKMPYVSQQVLPTSTSNDYTGTYKMAVIPTTANQYINIPVGYNTMSAYYTIRGSADLIPENIKSGVTLFNVEGALDAGFMLNEIGVSNVTSMNGQVPSISVNALRVGGYAQTGISGLDLTSCAATAIPSYFAYYCQSLSTVSLSSGKITNIHQYAFEHCGIIPKAFSITGTEKVSVIGVSAFANTPISQITSGMFSQTGWVSMSTGAFYGCSSLKIVDMPRCSRFVDGTDGLGTRQARNIFYNCYALESIYFSNLTSLSSPSFVYNCSALSDVRMPLLSIINTTSGAAFANCPSLSQISLPSLWQIMGGAALFSSVGLRSAVFTNTMSMLSGGTGQNQMVFTKCSQLSQISFTNVTATTGNVVGIAYNCSALESIYIGGSYPTNGMIAMSCPSLTCINLEGLYTQLNAVVSGCSSVLSIFAPNVKSWAWQMSSAAGCLSTLETVVLTNLSTMGTYGLRSCTALKNVSMPNVKVINQGAFLGCTALSELILTSVSSITTTAFSGCHNLISLNLTGVSSVPVLGGYAAFDSTPLYNYSTVAGQWGSIYVPASLYNSFINATNWKTASISARIVSV